MIRDAKFTDIPGIVALLSDSYQRTHYAKSGLVEIDIPETKRLLVNAIQRHGGKNGGATFVQVAERDGIITGIILGTLQRVYSIGNRLMATDLFWLASPSVDPLDPARLMKGMIEWARQSPHVVEVHCGTTAIIQDPADAGAILERLGMKNFGNIYRMEMR